MISASLKPIADARTSLGVVIAVPLTEVAVKMPPTVDLTRLLPITTVLALAELTTGASEEPESDEPEPVLVLGADG